MTGPVLDSMTRVDQDHFLLGSLQEFYCRKMLEVSENEYGKVYT